MADSNHNIPALSFTFENTALRIVDRDGEPWFVAKDVATALGYGDTDQAIRNHCKKGKILKPVESTGLEIGPRGAVIIPEGDVYRLIARSKLPSAVAFEEKVFEEILPSIRKTGRYQAKPAPKPAQPSAAQIREARLWRKDLDEIAGAIGLEGNQRVLSVNQGVRNIVGIDLMGAMGMTHLIAPTPHALMTPTDIGAEDDHGSGRVVNNLLIRYGYQTRHEDAKGKFSYEPTEKGLRCGAVMQDTSKKRSDGTPVRQLKWESRIVEHLRRDIELDNDVGEGPDAPTN